MAEFITIQYEDNLPIVIKKHEELLSTQKELLALEKTIAKDVKTSTKAREALLKEEIKLLDKLRKQRERAFDPADIEKFNSQIRKTEGRISSLKGEYNKLDKSNNVLGNSFRNVGIAIAAAFGTQQILQLGAEIIRMGAIAKPIQDAFERITPVGLLDDLRKATKGTITDLELMRQSVKASNFKIPLNEFARLLEFAQRRARETGESVQFLVDSIVSGIGRKSPLILDNLGISAVELRQKLKGVGVESVTVATVAQAVGSIVEEEFRRMGAAVDNTADKMDQFSTTIENLKTNIGTALAPAVGALATELNDRLKLAMNENLNLFEAFLVLLPKFGAVPGLAGMANVQLAQEEIAKATETANRAILDQSKAVFRLRERFINLEPASMAALAIEVDLEKAIAKLNTTVSKINPDMIDDLSRQLIELVNVGEALAQSADITTFFAQFDVDSLNSIKDYQEAIKNLQTELIKLDAESDKFAVTQAMITGLTADLARIQGKKTEADKLAEKAQRKLEQAEKARIRLLRQNLDKELARRTKLATEEIKNLIEAYKELNKQIDTNTKTQIDLINETAEKNIDLNRQIADTVRKGTDLEKLSFKQRIKESEDFFTEQLRIENQSFEQQKQLRLQEFGTQIAEVDKEKAALIRLRDEQGEDIVDRLSKQNTKERDIRKKQSKLLEVDAQIHQVKLNDIVIEGTNETEEITEDSFERRRQFILNNTSALLGELAALQQAISNQRLQALDEEIAREQKLNTERNAALTRRLELEQQLITRRGLGAKQEEEAQRLLLSQFEERNKAEIDGITALETERKQILRSQAEQAKALAVFEAIINVAKAITAHGVTTPQAIAAGLLGAIQIATIQAQPLPSFHTGEVAINPDQSNSKGEFGATLIKGESVIAAGPTKQYGPILEQMQNMAYNPISHALAAIGATQGPLTVNLDPTFQSKFLRATKANGTVNIGNVKDVVRMNRSESAKERMLG